MKFERKPDEFIVDGRKFYEVEEGISQIEEYLILSIEPPQQEEIHNMRLPDEFIVDYVRVYEKEGMGGSEREIS